MSFFPLLSFPLSSSFNYSGAWILKPNPRQPTLDLPPQHSLEAAWTVQYLRPCEGQTGILPPNVHSGMSPLTLDIESKVWNILLKWLNPAQRDTQLRTLMCDTKIQRGSLCLFLTA